MNGLTSKIINILVFQLFIFPVAMCEIISYHLDLTQKTLQGNLQESMGPQINDIKQKLENLETFVIEISGLEILPDDEKKQFFFTFSELLGSIMIQNPNENNLITCIYDKENPNSFAHHNGEVPFHTDGAFLTTPPRIIGIWVEQASNQGGETSLINLSRLLQQYRKIETEQQFLSMLMQPLPFHIHDSYHLPDTIPYILAIPISFNQIRFRLDLLLKGTEESSEITHKEDVIIAIHSFNEFINKYSEKFTFLMKTDHLYFFNNYYNLHNRESFIGERKIWRTWIN